jgi:antitoxin (DNA-binding transcriptional repressor) of toxin-antitoxin stability system
MIEVSVTEMQTNLDQLLDRIEGGEAVVIIRRGKPTAVLSAPEESSKRLASHADLRAFQKKEQADSLHHLQAMREDVRY